MGEFFQLQDLVVKYREDANIDFRLYLVPDLGNEGELFAVRGAHCAAKYNRFWDMVVELHRSDTLSKREVDITGQGLGLPVVEYRNCLDGSDNEEQIGKDLAYAQQKGISFKPTILVNGTVMIGAQPLENIDREIHKHLSE